MDGYYTVQRLRPSQFITTYGPGSILETTNGPVVICDFNKSGLIRKINNLDELRIIDDRMPCLLLDKEDNYSINIFKVPSNIDIGYQEDRYIYNTNIFPAWSLCSEHSILYMYDFKSRTGCPECEKIHQERDDFKKKAKARKEAIRFIMACPNGHISDVNWWRLIKHKEGCTAIENGYYKWHGVGGSLSNVYIECMKCKEKVNLGKAYREEHKCDGRMPEREDNFHPERHPDSCSSSAKMVQRNALFLRVPEILTTITIPPNVTRLHNILQIPEIKIRLETKSEEGNPITSKSRLIDDIINILIQKGKINKTFKDEIEKFSDNEISQILSDVLTSNVKPITMEELKQEEFIKLKEASENGSPPNFDSKRSESYYFEVIKDSRKNYTMKNGKIIRITPVRKLRAVMVQRGYRRPVKTYNDDKPKLIENYYIDENGQHWYPGVELFGEGLFIDCPNFNSNDLKGGHVKAWMTEWGNSQQDAHYNQYSQHPIFVWWHTLSHRIIQALSIN
jgi:hypothetical protein